MAKVSPAKVNFNTGEVSPLLSGRVDIDQYQNALKTSLNGIPLVQGGWTRRPGSCFAAECRSHAEKCYLYPFEFGVTQAYVLVFGPSYIRIMRNNALITEAAKTITAATSTNPVTLSSAGHGFSNGDRVAVAGVAGMSQINNREFTVAGVTTNTLQISGADGTVYDAYTSGGTVSKIVEIASPYAEEHLFELKFTQSADVLTITHPSYAQRKLARTSHTTWVLSEIVFIDGPYLAVNNTTTTVSASAASGVVNLVASAATFAATDVGRHVRIQHGAVWGWGIITAYTNSTHVALTTHSNFGAGWETSPASGVPAPVTTWRLGVWSTTTGWPGSTAYFEDRQFFGGTTAYPQRIDGSRSGDYETFSPSDLADGVVTDSHAVAFTLNSNDVNVVRWMNDDEKGLLVGTVGGEWIIRPSVQNEALSPTNVTAKQSTTYGSANIPAVKAGKATLFVTRSGRKVRELAYVFEVDGFRSPDMTVLAEHITKGGLTDICYQKDPQSVLWLTREDGTMLSFTYERDQQVLGWGRHELGGYSDSAQEDFAVVESVASIPASDGSRDEVYLVVKRYINGGTKRYIEYLSKMWEEDDDAEDAIFVDSAIAYDGPAVSSLSGLWHLEGQTVTVWANGATHPDRTVSSGKITLSASYTKVQVGLHYNSDGQMLRIEAGAADGTAQGKLQRNHRVIFRVWRTLGLRVGHEFSDSMYRPPMRTSGMETDAAVPLFTGDIETTWEGNYSTSNYVCWRFDQGAPGTILAVYPQMHTQDR